MRLKFWERKEENEVQWAPAGYVTCGELGRGAMGAVYLGREIANGREVAVKALSLADYFNVDALGDAREQFLREARTLAWLDHPDIVSIYDVGEEQGIAFIVMEVARGVRLSEFTHPGALLPLHRALEIVARVADALGYADEQNIAHRDIKPGNVMYDEATDSVKVMDFGIARMTHARASLLDVVQGSPRYMSPEQVRGEMVDGRSDLFSLGIVLYQLACGSLPFEGNDEPEVMRRIVREPHADILHARADIPSCVCAIIGRVLQKDKEMRYRNGYEMAEAIRRCVAVLQAG